MPSCHGRAAGVAQAARAERDKPTEMSRAILEELHSLHLTTSFAAPSSHLYHSADTTTPRPPGGIDLPWSSPLRHVSSGINSTMINKLGQPQFIPAPSLARTSDGFLLQESVRAIMARGGATSRNVLPEDAEIRAYEESKGSLAERAALTQGTAAEIMSRDTCVSCAPALSPPK